MHPQIFVRRQKLQQSGCVLGIRNPEQDDRQITRDAMWPTPRLRAGPGRDAGARGAQASIGTDQHPAQTLKIGGSGVGNPQMAQLHLSLGPGQGDGAIKGRRITMAIDQIQQGIRMVGNSGPERDPHHAPRRNQN